MQTFIGQLTTLTKQISKDIVIDKCPNCNRQKSMFFRNAMQTLECMCGTKFFGK